jgi:hypothetical protein
MSSSEAEFIKEAANRCETDFQEIQYKKISAQIWIVDLLGVIADTILSFFVGKKHKHGIADRMKPDAFKDKTKKVIDTSAIGFQNSEVLTNTKLWD